MRGFGLLLEFSAVANGALGWGFLFSWGFLGHDALLGNERHVLLTRIFQAEQRYVFQLPQWENKKRARRTLFSGHATCGSTLLVAVLLLLLTRLVALRVALLLLVVGIIGIALLLLPRIVLLLLLVLLVLVVLLVAGRVALRVIGLLRHFHTP
ncbi:hypothetical protein ACF8PL_16335 [Delftia sp. WSY_4]|jgi:hypothetical protein|uniref:hypothetical protein n=1 Tax=Delftia TaxID=80865 RepID=UPI0023DC13C4|nr:hypothetical protein [Delftia tsuruhatensis]MDH0773113.1 hypothetical protein [Delftia tsuruhatensis]MDH0850001.1 hypothetical protein [Delftia tsuruhatensis]MDH1457661.1 hypothetical protein [Delftia tsuruhatensis]MDH1823986.1 hypothetical protein [Delftia tsuruhatensis]WEM01945.1 hypothetical protein PW274_16180 [Delftia tsuruhatensis]